MIKRFFTCLIVLFSVCYSSLNIADDTELYVTESSIRTNDRPQVLIIFDTSGSMRSGFRANHFYNHGQTQTHYQSHSNSHGHAYGHSQHQSQTQSHESVTDSTTLYYSDDIEKVPSLNSKQIVQQKYNGCAQSTYYLEHYGMFTGYIRHYDSTSKTWKKLPENDGSSIDTIDCFIDISEHDQGNASGRQTNKHYPNGFPVDGHSEPYLAPSATNGSVDDIVVKAKKTGFGLGNSVTLYTRKYIEWYNSNRSATNYTRMDVAKQVITDTILNTPGVDFGLAIYNADSSSRSYGGRIIHGIRPFTDQNKKTILSTVQQLKPLGSTPLCDTLYEAYRYFSGSDVYYGKNQRDTNPNSDPHASANGKYLSPFVGKVCQSNASIVYITDGQPINDNHSISRISSLVGHSISRREGLPELAKWMYENDVNPNVDNSQNVTTYTIGYSRGADNARSLLEETARKGGGSYFSAVSSEALQKALQKVFAEVSNKPATFSSPAVSANRVNTNGVAYHSVFLPSRGARWSGNIKKLKINDKGEVFDVNNKAALNINGLLKSGSCSFWTQNCSSMPAGGDGSDVQLGGVAQHLQQNHTRYLLSNLGSNNALQLLTKANAQTALGDERKLAQFMKVTPSRLDELFKWIKGYDVNDDNNNHNTNELRKDIMGDSLHSKPLVINYGTEKTPNIKIFMGTNHGFMHMFSDNGNSVSESWAFMPKQLLPNVAELTTNQQSGVHSVYGLDSTPVAYVKRNASGTIDKAWLFFGMRRGGNAYYALDITQPDHPTLKWKVSPADLGFDKMGQTWSEPVITSIPGFPRNNTIAANAKPVMIVGAGYSPATKDSESVGINDTLGRGVYIIDADTGKMVHKFTANRGPNTTQLAGITDSIPNKVAIVDSDNDGLTDRLYATDTGANIWRIDLPSAQPTSNTAPWTAFKLASLGGQSIFNDRRFFTEPVIAQTITTNLHTVNLHGQSYKTYQDIPYDAVVIGSGHRPHPLDKNRQDKFFVIQDRNVVTKSFNGSINPVPDTLKIDDLYNVTDKPPSSESDEIAFSNKRGWYYNLTHPGEKSMSAPLIAKGRVFFTSYIPGDSTNAAQCFTTGTGHLYSFDLHRGVRSYKELSYETGKGIPDTPTIVVPQNSDSMYLIGIGRAGDKMEKAGNVNDGCAAGDDRCIGGGLQMNRIYFQSND
ncbi:pilus assembly protein [Shewanella intestini]|uniref:rRNA (Guanine-N1)-methyltransferase n=1 Tax=Shewanella intestini TaxID=2017544 RepID=A0ABS5I678_9GAMM|nr:MULTISPECIES: PilC/PilY family type IV pilus protein [Shewanella]MBR9729532.1 rRNA (guanine-N1)-methyltransferase [Shewanella intestini]MRG37527.1 rRNA (guanine-N1)-methyltransferase [Shewanella sp. XMDDZSB0408]